MATPKITISADETKQILELAELFEKRAAIELNAKKAIIEKLSSTAIEAIYTFFGVGYEGIVWTDVQLVDNVVIFALVVTYDSTTPPPDYIERFSPTANTGVVPAKTQRAMRIGIPAIQAFKPKEEVVQYLKAELEKLPPQENTPTKIIDASEQDDPREWLDDDDDDGNEDDIEFDAASDVSARVVSSPNAWDMGSLTKEQISDILFFQHQTLKKVQ